MAVGVHVDGSNAFPVDDNFAPLRRCLRPCPVRQTASHERDTRPRPSSLAQHFSAALRHLHFLPPTGILCIIAMRRQYMARADPSGSIFLARSSDFRFPAVTRHSVTAEARQ